MTLRMGLSVHSTSSGNFLQFYLVVLVTEMIFRKLECSNVTNVLNYAACVKKGNVTMRTRGHNGVYLISSLTEQE